MSVENITPRRVTPLEVKVNLLMKGGKKGKILSKTTNREQIRFQDMKINDEFLAQINIRLNVILETSCY